MFVRWHARHYYLLGQITSEKGPHKLCYEVVAQLTIPPKKGYHMSSVLGLRMGAWAGSLGLKCGQHKAL